MCTRCWSNRTSSAARGWSRLVTVDVRFADYDGPAQFGDDAKELEELVAAFHAFLRKQIDAARKTNPGKTVRLNLKAR